MLPSIFSFTHNVFKSPFSGSFKVGIVWQRVNARLEGFPGKTCRAHNWPTPLTYLNQSFYCFLTLSQTSPGFYVSTVQVFWKHCGIDWLIEWCFTQLSTVFQYTVGKEEIAGNKQFLLIPVFSTCLEIFLPFLSKFKLLCASSFSLGESKTGCLESVKENLIILKSIHK